MNPVRSILAVVGGIGVTLFTVQALEAVLVRASAGNTVVDLESFLVAANQPVMLIAKLVYSGLMGVLGGYLVGKVATRAPMGHAVFAAGLVAAVNVSGYTIDEQAAFTPMAIRVALVVIMSGAMLMGAMIRMKAVTLEAVNQGLTAEDADGRDKKEGQL